MIKELCKKNNVKVVICTHWSHGSDGTKELANMAVDLCNTNKGNFKFLYNDDISLWEKVETIAKEIYGAESVIADQKIKDQLKQFEESGYKKYPVCIAKTQYSFSTDPNLKGAPKGHVVPIRAVSYTHLRAHET